MRALGVFFAAVVCCSGAAAGATLSFNVTNTLSGKTVTGTPLKITINTDSDYLNLEFTAPYYDGQTNRVHLFLANQDNRISELQFTPSESILKMFWAPYNVLRQIPLGADQSSSMIAADKKTWSGTAKIHRDFLPPRISLYNAAAVHPVSKTDSNLQFDALYSITNHGIALPDLMVLPRYTPIGARFLFDNDEGYSKEWKASM